MRREIAAVRGARRVRLGPCPRRAPARTRRAARSARIDGGSTRAADRRAATSRARGTRVRWLRTTRPVPGSIWCAMKPPEQQGSGRDVGPARGDRSSDRPAQARRLPRDSTRYHRLRSVSGPVASGATTCRRWSVGEQRVGDAGEQVEPDALALVDRPPGHVPLRPTCRTVGRSAPEHVAGRCVRVVEVPTAGEQRRHPVGRGHVTAPKPTPRRRSTAIAQSASVSRTHATHQTGVAIGGLGLGEFGGDRQREQAAVGVVVARSRRTCSTATPSMA